MSTEGHGEVTALAINVRVPEELRWEDTRKDEVYVLQTLNVRLLPDGHVAAKAYGHSAAGRQGAYVAFPVPDRPQLRRLIQDAATRAGALWSAHRGLR